ncbi:unnamed protein product [Caenorhabditis auriculariae]|uniref:non-specific serine/threonine protein kinase n=1 Tax=Caenorhabditis auriculariae TaxID=2777116 RepID=A0A8S1HG47_9PELO|nr:unnamed protein product [Caenorhabditis auriculariae]
MGNINSLYTTLPSDIQPVEQYLLDLSCEYIENLGSTRFMRVAKGKNADGIFVYKVFVRQDASSLDPYPQRMMEIRRELANAPNCCPVKRVLVRPNIAVLLRWYQKHTLFDRLSTRPFVVYPEKIWYIYLLFKALAQCEAKGVCHGDLKSQNVLISSSNWLQITDFAPFKPTYLPQDNPSSFSFFFDTSRRQSCYLAPERLLPSTDYDHLFSTKKEEWLFGSLRPTMDVFSAGCIVYELFCDGRPPFTYSQLCEYRSMTSGEAAAVLEKLLQDVPVKFRPLLKLLLNREPDMRLSAKKVLDGCAFSFPPIFESFLFRYLDAFRPLFGPNTTSDGSGDDLSQPLECSYIEPDDVIAKLKREKNMWLAQLSLNDETKPFAVLFVSLITANMRALRSIRARTDAMGLLVELSSLCEPSVAMERVLPYFVHMFSEPEPQVRAAAVFSATDLLADIKPTTYEESIVFVDYLFPELSSLLTDDCPQHVLFTIAACLGTLAETAHKFMVEGRSIRAVSNDEDISIAETLSEGQLESDKSRVLLDSVSSIFMSLGSQDVVRHCLVNPQSLVKLYNFFNQMGDGDSLAKFIITFLNVKTDWRLRAAFFDWLPLCVQRHTAGIHTLLHQGLQDQEEWVVVRAIGCVHALLLNDSLDRASLIELLPDLTPFLVHPNEWIRMSVINVLVAVESRWSLADVHVKVLPLVKPFVQSDVRLIRLNSKVVLTNLLVDCIPRDVWRRLISLGLESTRKLVALLDAHLNRGAKFESSDQWFLRLFPRGDGWLSSEARNAGEGGRQTQEEARDQKLRMLFAFRTMLPKMADFRTTEGMESMLTRQMGIVDLSSKLHERVRRKRFAYGPRPFESDSRVVVSSTMNREWNEMFGDAFEQDDERREANTAGTMRGSLYESQVNALLTHLNEYHYRNVASRKSSLMKSQTGQSIRGALVTHLHEHSQQITKLAVHGDGEHFASSSADGTVRIWRRRTVVGEGSGAIRSDQLWTPSRNRKSVRSVGWATNNYAVAAVDDGQLVWADVSTGIKELSTIQLPPEDGAPMELHSFGPLSFVRTHHGVLYGLDTRVARSNGPLGKHEVWRKKINNDDGLVTCSTVDPWQQAWMVVGTTAKSSNLFLWDLRFHEEVISWKSPQGLRPMGVWTNSTASQNTPELFVAYNLSGDVSMFELSAQLTRTKVLRSESRSSIGAHSRPLDSVVDTHDAVSSLQTRALCVCELTGTVYTGDTEGSLRRWNTSRAALCRTMSARPKGRMSLMTVYEETPPNQPPPMLIYECSVTSNSKEHRPTVPLETKPATFHRTPITDIALLNETLVSASADGIIKKPWRDDERPIPRGVVAAFDSVCLAAYKTGQEDSAGGPSVRLSYLAVISGFVHCVVARKIVKPPEMHPSLLPLVLVPTVRS